MSQSSFFFYQRRRPASYRGDIQSDKSAYLWVVEYKQHNDSYLPVGATFWTRQDARSEARTARSMGFEVRVVPYKACVDTKGRSNRQIQSERLS